VTTRGAILGVHHYIKKAFTFNYPLGPFDMSSRAMIQSRASSIWEKYGILLAGIFIFAYYLWAAINLFGSPNPRRDFQGYFFQFSSVVLLWGLAFLGAKLFEYMKKQKEEQEKNQTLVQEYEHRRMQLELLDEVSTMLNDTVNNPLAIISVSASSIRERFQPDDPVLVYLDSIDGALKRVQEVLADFKSHQTKKIVNSLHSMPSRFPTTRQEPLLSVDPKGEIRST
jgi:hypothetical protein